MLEIYTQVFFKRKSIPYSPTTGKPIESQSASQITEKIKKLADQSKIVIIAPIIRGEKGEHQKELFLLKKQGFERLRIDGIDYTFDDLPVIDRNKKHTVELIVDRIVLSESIGNRLAESISTALKHGNGVVYVEVIGNPSERLVFSDKFCCPISGFQLEEIEPRIFSFNSPFGACSKCHGLGMEKFFDPKLIVPNPDLSLNEGAVVPWESFPSRERLAMLRAISEHYRFNLDWPFEKLSQDIQDVIFHGSHGKLIDVSYFDGMKTRTIQKEYEGVIVELERRLDQITDTGCKDLVSRFQNIQPCSACDGYRLRKESLCVKILDKHIGQISSFTIQQAFNWFEKLPNYLGEKHNEIASKVIQEISSRLRFLLNVGLDYLTLSRKTDSISGGEGQRIRLASQIGSGLSGVLYVLDEPSIGLHQRDNMRLIATLRHLADIGNTVVVVEHDEETILAACCIFMNATQRL